MPRPSTSSNAGATHGLPLLWLLKRRQHGVDLA